MKQANTQMNRPAKGDVESDFVIGATYRAQ